jgi:hypothetical protein
MSGIPQAGRGAGSSGVAGGGRKVAAAASLLAGALVAAVAGGFVEPAEAACLSPQLSLSAPTAHAGDTIIVSGSAFGDGCNDVIVGPGPPPAPLGSPLTGVELQFQQGGRVVPLGTVDADGDYKFSMPITVPGDARPGPADIMAVMTGSKTAIPAPLAVLPATIVSDAEAADPPAAGDGPVGVVAARPSFTG